MWNLSFEFSKYREWAKPNSSEHTEHIQTHAHIETEKNERSLEIRK